MTQNATGTSGDTFKEAYILSDKSTDVEAFFESENLKPNGAVNSYNNKKIVLRETSSSTASPQAGKNHLKDQPMMSPPPQSKPSRNG